MSTEDLRPEMERRVKDVTEVLDVSKAAGAVLLRHFAWSKEALLEAYMQDSDKILNLVGVFSRCGGRKENSGKKNKIDKECPICYEESDSMMAMPCGHAFCLDCWNDFCNCHVQEGPACVQTTCPNAMCPEVVTEEEFSKALVDNAPILQKYLTYQLRSFVDSNALTRCCPGPGCERVAYALSPAAMEAEGCVASCDKCDSSFCLVCGEEPHSPATCKDLTSWNEKCRNESETANWILANTKTCPKCLSRIEKNQGCNHMTCQKCRHEFCWICMGDWKDHGANTGGYYKCNKFDNGSIPDGSDQSEQAKAKRDLDRYLHYYKRYHAHSEAQTFAVKQLKETANRMVLLQDASEDAKWTDVEFLKQANEQLVECRRVLKYTYVFGFYLNPTHRQQRDRFEYHQEMLERFTENLSELSEKPLQEMDRTDVVNQTRVVDKFMKNVLKYVEDGLEGA